MFKLDQQAYFKDLEHIINIDSPSSYPEGNQKIIDFFANKFEVLGWITDITTPSTESGPCLVATNRKSENYDIVMIGHVDTVFPVGTVQERPFKISDNIITGPGVEDMKSGTLFMYYLAKVFTDNNLLQNANICIIINSDEEIGSKHSRPIIEEIAKKSKYALVFESADKNGRMTKGRKGIGRYFVNFKGIAAHSGANPEKGASAVNEFLHWGSKFTQLHNLSEGTCINIGVVHGGTAPNVIAEEVNIEIDVRITKMEPVRQIKSLIQELQASPQNPKVTITTKGGITRPPMVPTDKSETLCSLFVQTAQELNLPPAEFQSVGGGSDANLTAAVGTTSIDGLGPTGDNSHSDKEYTLLDSYEPKFKLLAHVINKLIKQ